MACPKSLIDEEPSAWHSWDRDKPDQPVYGELKLSQVPRHKVHAALVGEIAHCRHALHLVIPEQTSEYDGEDFFHPFRWFDYDRYDSMFDEEKEKEEDTRTETEKILDPKREMRTGYVDFPDHEHVCVKLGIRRPPRPSEEQIAECLRILQNDTEQWHGGSIDKSFYGRCILPHVLEKDTDDPFVWAHDRVEIAVGYSTMLAGPDFPPLYMAEPYTVLARAATGTAYEKTHALRTYEMPPARQEILTELFALLPDEILPEATAFVCELGDDLTNAMLADPYVQSFLKNLPLLLANGLLIDRIVELVRKSVKAGSSLPEALAYATSLSQYIYGGKNEPWWFHEDFDLSEGFAMEEEATTDCRGLPGYEWTADNREFVLAIAREAGFAYREALDLYSRFERVFPTISGVDEHEWISLTSLVARDYGIGNLLRAMKVMELLCEGLMSTPEADRLKVITQAKRHLHDYRPASELIGRLEGSDISFDLPGVAPLVRGLITQEEAKNVDAVTLQMRHLTALDEHLRLPPPARASVRPLIATGVQTTRLLSSVLDAPVALLPAPEKESEQGVFSGLLGFYEQMREECGHVSSEVSSIYFTFCAQRLPDPLRPPKGLLKVIKRFRDIPDPNHHHEILEDPRDREHTRRRNEKKYVKRQELLSHLLDAAMCGICTYEDVLSILQWMTEEASREFVERRKSEMTEEQERYRKEGHHYPRKYIGEKRAEYLKEIAQSLEISMSSRDPDIRERLSRNIKYLVQKRDGVAQELYPRDEDKSHKMSRGMQRRHRKRRMMDDIRIEQNQTCQQRILTVAQGIHELERLQILVAAGLLPKDVILRTVQTLFQEWKSGKTVDIAEPSEHEDSHWGDVIFTAMKINQLKNLAEFNVIEMSDLQKAIGDLDARNSLDRIFGLIDQIVNAWNETKEMTVQLEQSYSIRNSFGISQEFPWDELADKIRYLWNSISFIRKEAIEELLKGVLWKHRYAFAFDDVEHVTRKLGNPEHERTRSQSQVANFDMVFRQTTAAIASLMEYEEQWNPLLTFLDERPLRALPEPENAERMPDAPSPLEIARGRRIESIQRHMDAWNQKGLEWRNNALGLLPVGAKIHVLHPIDDERFHTVAEFFGYQRSGFYLIHANTCLIIHAMPSAEELSMVMGFLANEGVIDLDHPEIQVTCPGRLPPQDCAVVGSAILLSTDRGLRFQEHAFKTSHGITGARMLAYDAGRQNVDLPFMRGLKGRTDILGRRSMRDIGNYQLVKSVLQDRCTGGAFAALADPFCLQHAEILQRYDIQDVLKASWIAAEGDDTNDDAKNAAHFQNAIKPCLDAYFANSDAVQETGQESGIIYEMRNLLDWLRTEVSTIQKTLPGHPDYAVDCEKVLKGFRDAKHVQQAPKCLTVTV